MVHTAGKMSKGAVHPIDARTPATVAGMSCMEAVFKTISRHISLVATVGAAGLIILRTARIPRGVAAFPSPKRFAQMFALRSCASMVSFFVLGKILPIIGESSRESILVSPAPCITSATPDHRHIVPAMEKDRVIPVCAPLSIAEDTSVIFPFIAENKKDKNKIIVHTQLITMRIPPMMQIMQ